MAAKCLRHEHLGKRERGAEGSLTIPQLLLELLSGSGEKTKRRGLERRDAESQGRRSKREVSFKDAQNPRSAIHLGPRQKTEGETLALFPFSFALSICMEGTLQLGIRGFQRCLFLTFVYQMNSAMTICGTATSLRTAWNNSGKQCSYHNSLQD